MNKAKQLIFLSIILFFNTNHLAASTLKKESAATVDLNAVGEDDGRTVLTRELSRPFYNQDEASVSFKMGHDYKPKPAISAHEMQVLVKSGADINKADAHGNTPLHAAVRSVNSECTSTLLALNANPNLYNKTGYTPLMLLISDLGERGFRELRERIALARILISNDTVSLDVQSLTGPYKSIEGYTALGMLCSNPVPGSMELFNLFIDQQADLFIGNPEFLLSERLQKMQESIAQSPYADECPSSFDSTQAMLKIIQERKKNLKQVPFVADILLLSKDHIGIPELVAVVHSYYTIEPAIKQEQNQQAKVELIP